MSSVAWRVAAAAVGVTVASGAVVAQRAPVTNSVLDVLVFGAEVPIDPWQYGESVRAAAQQHRQRYYAYDPGRRPVPERADEGMVQAAHIRYERRLFAMTSDPNARTLAARCVARMGPCYEWEGFHDCPEREARFASEYLGANPNSPFREYLPLLAAHRWICTAEGYDLEEKPQDAARSRRECESVLAVARRSTDLLVRTAAEELQARLRCFPPRDYGYN